MKGAFNSLYSFLKPKFKKITSIDVDAILMRFDLDWDMKLSY